MFYLLRYIAKETEMFIEQNIHKNTASKASDVETITQIHMVHQEINSICEMMNQETQMTFEVDHKGIETSIKTSNKSVQYEQVELTIDHMKPIRLGKLSTIADDLMIAVNKSKAAFTQTDVINSFEIEEDHVEVVENHKIETIEQESQTIRADTTQNDTQTFNAETSESDTQTVQIEKIHNDTQTDLPLIENMDEIPVEAVEKDTNTSFELILKQDYEVVVTDFDKLKAEIDICKQQNTELIKLKDELQISYDHYKEEHSTNTNSSKLEIEEARSQLSSSNSNLL